MILPDYVNEIIKTLEKASFEAYAVGGCVRDSLSGIEAHDYDITTNAVPLQIKQLFKKTVDTGIKHGTVTVIIGKENCEVTTYRTEAAYINNRKPESVEFVSSIAEDIKRRDFTINALAYNPSTGVVDLCGGKQDIENKIIRCVGNPDERFKEDALRMLRAVRFACKTGFVIEKNTLTAIQNNAKLIQHISAERIKSELDKCLISNNPETLELLYTTGLSKYILPEFDACINCEQNTVHHIYNVGIHILKAVSYSKKDIVLRWALLLHDIGKPLTKTTDSNNQDHFKGHEHKSMLMARDVLNRLKFDNASKKTILILIDNHRYSMPDDGASVRKKVSEIGIERFELLLDFMYADTMAHSEKAKKTRLEKIERLRSEMLKIKQNNLPVSLKQLEVDGNDLLTLGVEKQKIGAILNKLLDEVILTPELNHKDILIDYIKNRL